MPTWTERMAAAKRPQNMIDKITTRMEELAPEMKRLRKLQEEFEDMKNALLLHANEEYEPTSEVSFTSDAIEVDFSAVPVIRKIKDVKGLMSALGRRVFLTYASFPMDKLDQLMTRDEQKKYVSFRRVGTRSCRIKLTTEKK